MFKPQKNYDFFQKMLSCPIYELCQSLLIILHSQRYVFFGHLVINIIIFSIIDRLYFLFGGDEAMYRKGKALGVT